MGWDAIKKLADYEDTGLEPEQVLLEVVRCKDCKNAYSDEMFEGLWCRGRKMKPHDFCSCGERRDE